MSPLDPERLACGRSWDELIEQVGDGQPGPRDDHQRDCPHCEAALSELDRLWRPLQRLAAEPVTAPAGLVDRVMSRVCDAARHSWYGLLPDAGGTSRVAARVLGKLARVAAGRVPGVTVALGRTTDAPAAAGARRATDTHTWPGAAVGIAGSSAVIDLALTAAYGADLRGLAERVRRAVLSEIARTTGLRDVHVNITIDDVTPGPPPRRADGTADRPGQGR